MFTLVAAAVSYVPSIFYWLVRSIDSTSIRLPFSALRHLTLPLGVLWLGQSPPWLYYDHTTTTTTLRLKHTRLPTLPLVFSLKSSLRFIAVMGKATRRPGNCIHVINPPDFCHSSAWLGPLERETDRDKQTGRRGAGEPRRTPVIHLLAITLTTFTLAPLTLTRLGSIANCSSRLAPWW